MPSNPHRHIRDLMELVRSHGADVSVDNRGRHPKLLIRLRGQTLRFPVSKNPRGACAPANQRAEVTRLLRNIP